MYSGEPLIRGVFGTLTIVTFFSLPCMAKCPTKSAAIPLSIAEFSGEWLMLAGTPTSGDSVSKCCFLAVTPTSLDTFEMNFTAISRRSHRPVTFTMNAKVDDDDVIGYWQLQGSKRLLGPFKHRIIAAEYGSYLVMVVCADNATDIPLHEFAMILSRDIALSPVILQALKEELLPYFNSDKILDVDHSRC